MLHSKGFKRFMAMAYGIGGAIVIIGALFKLMHWEWASEMLILGLGTEAFIFFISAFEPLPQEELDWSVVYPELAGGQSQGRKKKEVSTPEGILTQKIDGMLAAAKLGLKVVELDTSITSVDDVRAALKISDCKSIIFDPIGGE